MLNKLQSTACLALALAAFAPGAAYGQAATCGSLENAFGPYDYTNPVHKRDLLPPVEQFHFDSGVERLRGRLDLDEKQGKAAVGKAIDYTLRAFPNHHRALYAMARYHLTMRDENRPPMRYTADCYFDRAMRFKPSDGKVRLIYGIFLYKLGKNEAAVERFQEALSRTPDSAEVHYNIGLIYADMGRYNEAKQHAVTAYDLGYPMPGLRNKLIRAGVWN